MLRNSIVLVLLLAGSVLATPPPAPTSHAATTHAATTAASSASSSGKVCCTTSACQAVYQTVTTSSTSISGGTRAVTFEGCPGYNWASTTPNSATEQAATIKMNLNAILRSDNQTVGLTNPVLGSIGVAINGVALFSPSDGEGRDAWIYEGSSMDSCYGHADGDGVYHYHTAPATGCVYTDTAGQHSPMFGMMADGIPIYGKLDVNGIAPTNLDSCGGHVGPVTTNGVTATFYHYHAQTSYPYLVNCLMGCVQAGQIQSSKISSTCTEAATQYTSAYESLANAFTTTPSGYTWSTELFESEGPQDHQLLALNNQGDTVVLLGPDSGAARVGLTMAASMIALVAMMLLLA